jgi:hypothetical protein
MKKLLVLDNLSDKLLREASEKARIFKSCLLSWGIPIIFERSFIHFLHNFVNLIAGL